MKSILLSCYLLICVGVNAQNKNSLTSITNRCIPFDNNWLFIKDSISNAEEIDFNDSQWEKVDLTHDWSLNDLPNQTEGSIVGPFDKRSPGIKKNGFTRGSTR